MCEHNNSSDNSAGPSGRLQNDPGLSPVSISIAQPLCEHNSIYDSCAQPDSSAGPNSRLAQPDDSKVSCDDFPEFDEFFCDAGTADPLGSELTPPDLHPLLVKVNSPEGDCDQYDNDVCRSGSSTSNDLRVNLLMFRFLLIGIA